MCYKILSDQNKIISILEKIWFFVQQELLRLRNTYKFNENHYLEKEIVTNLRNNDFDYQVFDFD